MTEWRWVDPRVVDAVHDKELAEHGGRPGIRDRALIESALQRPLNRAHYGTPDLAELAAAYAFGLVRDHGYVDGNKRVAWTVARIFLLDNGASLKFGPVDAVQMMEQCASGVLSEEQVAEWFRTRLTGPGA